MSTTRREVAPNFVLIGIIIFLKNEFTTFGLRHLKSFNFNIPNKSVNNFGNFVIPLLNCTKV